MTESATSDLLKLTDKKYLVIGGGQGMGESTSLLLGSQGASVAVLDLDLSRAEAVRDKVIGLGAKSIAISADVVDDDQLRAAVARADNELGGLDGLVAIVGMAGFTPLLDMTSEFWDRDQQRNLRYFFIAAQDAARRITARGGSASFVCLSSVDGIRSAENHASYGAAKAGLINLVKSMAAEWTELGIRVNAVAPGTMVSPRLPLLSPEIETEATRLVPARHRGSIDDIGKAVVFFLSDLSTYISGQTLAVDGGLTAVGPLDYRAMAARAGNGGTFGESHARP